MNILLILIAKIAYTAVKVLGLGAGSTWPGHIAMESNPNFLKQTIAKNKDLKVVLVAGTNGKTTTSKMLKIILEKKGLRVIQNEEGANLLNGMASTVIRHANILGRLDYDIAIFETDENNLRPALKELTPHAILLLNIFRDQLDRYGEVNKIANDWQESLSTLGDRTILITNGDDPELTYIAEQAGLRTYFFGIDEKEMAHKEMGHDTDFNYCPKCGTELQYSKVSYSHLGRFRCPKCKYGNPKIRIVNDLIYPLFGKYNIYNTNAAAVCASLVFDVGIGEINQGLDDFKPAFGRQETISHQGRNVTILLSKNPAGFNQSIEAVKNMRGNSLIILNDRIPDGRDVSWIWDVDFENLDSTKEIFVAGDRGYDMALRFKYATGSFDKVKVFEDLTLAINESIDKTPKGSNLFILATYSAMLESREILLGKKIS